MLDGDVFDFVGKTIHGKYRIDEVIGEGGFGVVYRGYHLSFEQPIAVKCLKVPTHFTAEAREVFLDRFRQEGKHLAALGQHGSVTRVYDFAVAQGPADEAVPYLVLEWLDGRDLDAILAERGRHGRPYTEREALELLRPAIDALAFAHDLNIAHRDIKPANLFFANTARGPLLKILDFGIAKVMQDGDRATRAPTRSNSGFRAFSPRYGAPEQFVESTFGATGPWTDVHALGLILTELVGGRPAMDCDTAVDLYQTATGARRPTPRARGVDVTDGFERIVQKALALRPDDRYRDAQAMLTDVDGWLMSGERSVIRPPGTPRERDLPLSAAETKLAEISSVSTLESEGARHRGAEAASAGERPSRLDTAPSATDHQAPHLSAPAASPVAWAPAGSTPPAGPYPATPATPASPAAPRTPASPASPGLPGSPAWPPPPPYSPPARVPAQPASSGSGIGKIVALALGLFVVALGGVAIAVGIVSDVETETVAEDPEEEPEELPSADTCRDGLAAPCTVACDGGDQASCVRLGWMHVEANGVPRDYDRARALFDAACEAGNALGCNNLGWLHHQGWGVPANHRVAVSYFRRACDQHDDRGCNNLASAYRTGLGVSPNIREAMRIYEEACDRGNAHSCNHLGVIYNTDERIPLDAARAAELYRKACDGGAADGCSNIGYLYEHGQGVGANAGLAVHHYRRGCDGGSPLGCNNLGWAYERGLGPLAKDLAEAKRFYRRACDAGSDLGCTNLNKLGG